MAHEPLKVPERIPEPGFYFHYKHFDALGNPDNRVDKYAYLILGVGHHTERDEWLFTYRPLYPEASVYQAGKFFDDRPLEMFFDPAFLDGKPVERFQRITDPAIIEQLKEQHLKLYGTKAGVIFEI